MMDTMHCPSKVHGVACAVNPIVNEFDDEEHGDEGERACAFVSETVVCVDGMVWIECEVNTHQLFRKCHITAKAE